MSTALLLLAGATPLRAAPTLSVRNGGANVGDQLWIVEVAPDARLFSETVNGHGGSLAVELTLEITGTDLVGAASNAEDWPYDNPGNNPFTSSVTEGVQVDVTNNTVFASLGSEFLSSDDPIKVLAIRTSGTISGTLNWGGQTVRGGTPQAFTAAIIAQAGMLSGPYIGSLTVGSDANLDAVVDGNDFLVLQRNDPAQIAAWQADFGTGAAVSAVALVPEPHTLKLLVLMATALMPHRRGR